MSMRPDGEAMMFLGDNWIGTEPCGEEYFSGSVLDAVLVLWAACAALLRLISDIPGVKKYTEAVFCRTFSRTPFMRAMIRVLRQSITGCAPVGRLCASLWTVSATAAAKPL